MIKIRLEAFPIYTFFGVKQGYKLGDMAYGQWLIFKNNQPFYYFDIFDEEEYDSYIQSIIDREGIYYLKRKFKEKYNDLTISQTYCGNRASRKIIDKWFELEKLPVSFFE